MLFFPHEIGVVGGQLVLDQSQFIWVPGLQQMIDEFGKAVVPPLLDGGGKAAGNELALFAQIDAKGSVHELGQPLKIGF